MKTAYKDTDIRVRVPQSLKSSTTAIFRELGLNMSDAVNMFLVQVEREKGIPFEIRLAPSTEQALLEASEGQLTHYESIDEMNKDLGI